MRAAVPAVRRAGGFLLMLGVFVVLGAYWVTDGFERYPTWDDWAQWVKDHQTLQNRPL